MKGYVVRGGIPVFASIEEPQLFPNTVIIKNIALGLNKLDHSSLANPDFETKYGLGFEGVGIVEVVDESCQKKFTVGQRVCYATAHGVGAFAEKIAIHEDFLIPIPGDISTEDAATLFKGLAAHMLLFRTYNLKGSNVIGVTSASGGVASYLTQWAASEGVAVIGMVANSSHRQIAAANGCTAVFSPKEANAYIKEAQNLSLSKLGLNVFYDSLGAKVFPLGIKALAPFGIYINYGNITGEITQISAQHFQKKALFFTTPSVFYSKAYPVELSLTAEMFFDKIRNGTLRPNITKYKFASLPEALEEVGNGVVPGQKVAMLD
jgi:NADPH2:quinone reductase